MFAGPLCPEYGYGGVLTLDVGTEQLAQTLMSALQNQHQFDFVAFSVGYFDTLISCPASSTSSEMVDEDIAAAGISPGLIRILVGYTDTLEQRWTQHTNDH